MHELLVKQEGLSRKKATEIVLKTIDKSYSFLNKENKEIFKSVYKVSKKYFMLL